MARRRRSKKAPKFTLTVIVGILALAGIGSLFSRVEPPVQAPSSPAYGTSTNPPASTVEQQIASRPSEPAVKPPISPPIQTHAEPQAEAQAATRFVKGRKVALRDGPGKQFGILDRYDSGREVSVLETHGDWSHIVDNLTQRDGWVSTSLLSEQRQSSREGKNQASSEKKPEVSGARAALPDALVVQRMIAQSIAMYPGSCACPYNTDRGGRRCGKRSAYNRGGGYAPLCFAGDISSGMIAAFREQASR